MNSIELAEEFDRSIRAIGKSGGKIMFEAVMVVGDFNVNSVGESHDEIW